MSFSIRMTKQEQELATAYAKLHGVSVGEAMKSALFDRIEDEFDLKLAESSLQEFEQDPKTYSLEEARNILEL